MDTAVGEAENIVPEMPELVLVEGLDEAEPAVQAENTVKYDEEALNLVADFEASEYGRGWLSRIAEDTIESFETDFESCADWRKKCAEIIDRYVCKPPKKIDEMQNIANAAMPITIETLSRLISRIVSEIFGDYKSVFGVIPANDGEQAENMAKVLTQHGNYQFRNEIPDFQRQSVRLVTWGVLCGSMISYSYYNVEREQNHHIAISPDDFAFPYAHLCSQPDLSDLPRYTWIRRMYAHQLESERDNSGWLNVDKVLGEEVETEDEPEQPVTKAMTEKLGHEMPENADRTAGTYVVLHWEGWLKLPAQERLRWCQVIVHKQTRKILKLKVLEEADWRERARYERQSAEASMYRESRLEWEALRDQGKAQNETMMALAMEEAERNERYVPELEAAAAVSDEAELRLPPEPLPPSWMLTKDPFEQPKPMRKKQVCMFAYGVMLENLVGALGLGMGHITVEYDKASNVLWSQFIDAATFANTQTLVTTKGVTFEGGMRIRPGHQNKVTGLSNHDLANGALQVLKFDPANEQLRISANELHEKARQAISSPDVLGGAPGKSGETRGGLNSRIEQATKQLSSMARSAAAVVRQIVINNAILNSMFLPNESIFMVLDDQLGRWAQQSLSRNAYLRSYQVEFSSDMKFASDEQKIREADEIAMMVLKTPQLQNNAAMAYEAIKGALAARGQHKLIALLGARPPAPPVFLGLQPPPPPGLPPAEAGQPPLSKPDTG